MNYLHLLLLVLCDVTLLRRPSFIFYSFPSMALPLYSFPSLPYRQTLYQAEHASIYLYACLQNVHCKCVHVLYLNIFVQVQGNMHKNPPFLAYSSTGVEEHTRSRGSHHNQDKEHRHPPTTPLSVLWVGVFLVIPVDLLLICLDGFVLQNSFFSPTFVTKTSIYVALRPSPLPLG